MMVWLVQIVIINLVLSAENWPVMIFYGSSSREKTSGEQSPRAPKSSSVFVVKTAENGRQERGPLIRVEEEKVTGAGKEIRKETREKALSPVKEKRVSHLVVSKVTKGKMQVVSPHRIPLANAPAIELPVDVQRLARLFLASVALPTPTGVVALCRPSHVFRTPMFMAFMKKAQWIVSFWSVLKCAQ